MWWGKILIVLGMITGLILVARFLFLLWFHQKEKVLENVSVAKNDSLTLFIPGTHGGAISFGGMIKRLDKYQLGNFSYTVKIHSDKTFTELKRKGFQPNGMIQLIFDDNTDAKAENEQLFTYMQYLKKLGIQNVNLVGHSTGGPMSTDFLIKYGKNNTIPKIKKFISISGDFKLPLPNAYINDGKKLPKDLKALNISGKIWGFETDGLVPLKEVIVMKDIFKENVASYRYVELDGSPLSTFHFMLHENPEVDKLVAEFLWN